MNQKPSQKIGRRGLLRVMGEITIGATVAASLGLVRANPAEACFACPGWGTQNTICLCNPNSSCSSKATAAIVTYYGGCIHGSICSCQQTFTNAGYCCSASSSCYCSSR